jgi:hypothetical protein
LSSSALEVIQKSEWRGSQCNTSEDAPDSTLSGSVKLHTLSPLATSAATTKAEASARRRRRWHRKPLAAKHNNALKEHRRGKSSR